MSKHEHETTDRGFKHYPVIETSYGHKLRVYESSAAEGPHLWLAVDGTEARNERDSEPGELHVHLTAEQAGELRDALTIALALHYQTHS